jgi:hypothetical protein
MNFLDEHQWSGKIFTGEWTAPDGVTIPVVEPATGDRDRPRGRSVTRRPGAVGGPGP